MNQHKYCNPRIVYDNKHNMGIANINNEYFLIKSSYENLIKKINPLNITYQKDDTFLTRFISIIMIFTIIGSLIYYYVSVSANSNHLNIWIISIILFVNIVIHEACHIICLRIYGEKESSIGFKFVFVFPTFYIRTSSAYMLSKYRRIQVYLSGLFANSLFIIISILVLKMLHKNYIINNLWIVVVTIIANCIPIVKTDIYHSLLALFNKFDFKKNNSKLTNLLRGIIVFVLYRLMFK